MCKAIDDLIEEGEKRGRIMGVIQACQLMRQTKESTLSMIIAQFQLKRKEAEELVEANWNS